MTGEMLITEYIDEYTVSGSVTYGFSSGTFTSASYDPEHWGVSVNTISGLEHLEGKTVTILADGGTIPDEVVSGGEITLETDAFVAVVGLGYQSVYKSLPVETGPAKKKRIHLIDMRFYRTAGIEMGRDEDNTQAVFLRDPATLLGMPELLFTGLKDSLKPNTSADEEGQFVILQNKPYPMCILAIILNMVEWD
jgi:hypothetical protein